MASTIRVLSKPSIYYASILLAAVYWSMIASPRYCAQASLVVEARQDVGTNAIPARREQYILSKDGRALLGAWLKSEAPFRIIDARRPQNGLYSEVNLFKRFMHVGSLRKSKDWSHWKTFEDDLQISEDSQFISLKFESFDSKTSYLILKEIIRSANDYLSRYSEEKDNLYRRRESFTKNYYENEIRKIELGHDTTYYSTVLSQLSGLYQRSERLSEKLMDNKMAFSVKNIYYGENSATIRGITTNIDILREYFISVGRDIDNAIKSLPGSELREAQLRTAVNAITENTLPDYSVERGVYMPQYRISVISDPSQFRQESGPQRIRSFFLTLVFFSILYWIVKD